MSINASPTSEIRKQFAKVIEQYQDELDEIETTIRQIADEIDSQQTLKREEEQLIVDEYEKRRPTSTAPRIRSRNPVVDMSKARSKKDAADSWVETQRMERCEPIKAEISRLEERSDSLKKQLLSVRAGFNDRLFNSLPVPKKSWKTGKDGRVSIDIPNDAPWTVWSIASHEYSTGKVRDRRGTVRSNSGGATYSETEIEQDIRREKQVRWILEIPTDLDSNSSLSLDLTTAFDERGVTVTTDSTDGPYFRLNSRR